MSRGGGGSHWEGCYEAHHDCALARIAELEATVEELREGLQTIKLISRAEKATIAELTSEAKASRRAASAWYKAAQGFLKRAEAAERESEPPTCPECHVCDMMSTGTHHLRCCSQCEERDE